MRTIFFVIILSFPGFLLGQLWNITPMAPLPEPVSNNAVSSAQVGDTAYVYSFGGIDSTKVFSGIHLRSYRYNTLADRWDNLASMPDTLGKIAAGASRVGQVIYIMGGYHVFANGGERSSNKVHRFDVVQNQFISEGAPIPVPIDDHVQAVWKDSLIFLVTGWSDTRNVPAVQIYDPALDQWQAGTSVPNNTTYNSFGASGYIVEDTIYYFGGAAFGPNFPIQNDFRKGVIDPQNPTQIQWQSTILANNLVAYRSGTIRVYEYLHWIGGSATTYNYDGIAYDGSGGVAPSQLNLFYHIPTGSWNQIPVPGLPMDLRGVAEISPETKYIVGGMQDAQRVSDQCLLLQYDNRIGNDLQEGPNFWQVPKVLPNPVSASFRIIGGPSSFATATIKAWDIQGKEVELAPSRNGESPISVSHLAAGLYLIQLSKNEQSFFLKMLKR